MDYSTFTNDSSSGCDSDEENNVERKERMKMNKEEKKGKYLKSAIIFVCLSLLASFCVGAIIYECWKDNTSDNKLYTYPLLVENKTFIVTVETNWNGKATPDVSLDNTSTVPNETRLSLYFRGRSEKNTTDWETLTYNITMPTELIGEVTSLIRKYSPQDPSRYNLSNNSTHTSLQMTLEYSSMFSGSGYFLIKGTKPSPIFSENIFDDNLKIIDSIFERNYDLNIPWNQTDLRITVLGLNGTDVRKIDVQIRSRGEVIKNQTLGYGERFYFSEERQTDGLYLGISYHITKGETIDIFDPKLQDKFPEVWFRVKIEREFFP